MGEGQHDGVGAVHAPAVVLATGGMGQVFSATTNPSVSTGDGVALALRAGAEVTDLEFVQFHPTVLFLGRGRRGPAAAGLGGGPRRGRVPRRRGRRAVHGGAARAGRAGARATSSPRASCAGCSEHGASTCTSTPGTSAREMWEQRFPTILAACRAHGIDPVDRADPGRAGRALRLRRRPHRPARPHHHPRPVRLRRGGLHRRARREPAGLQLAAGGAGLRRADRRRHRSPSRPAGSRPGHAGPGDRPAAARRRPARDPADHDATGAGVLRSADVADAAADALEALYADAAGRPRSARQDRRARRRDLGGDEPADRGAGRWSPRRRGARRPAAATGARTTPSGTTRTGAATSSSGSRRRSAPWSSPTDSADFPSVHAPERPGA